MLMEDLALQVEQQKLGEIAYNLTKAELALVTEDVSSK